MKETRIDEGEGIKPGTSSFREINVDVWATVFLTFTEISGPRIVKEFVKASPETIGEITKQMTAQGFGLGYRREIAAAIIADQVPADVSTIVKVPDGVGTRDPYPVAIRGTEKWSLLARNKADLPSEFHILFVKHLR